MDTQGAIASPMFNSSESSPAFLQPPINNTDIAKVPAFDENSEKETDDVDSLVDAGELSSNPPDAFVPSLGAWAKPLTFAPPATPPMPATPSDFDPQDTHTAVREFPRITVQNIHVLELKDDGTLRFPWAARMNPATRNLYRAAKPTFRLDGTPQVTIPSQVSNEVRGVETDKEPAQFSAVSDQVVIQIENSKKSLVLASTDQIVEHINEIEIEELQSQKGIFHSTLSQHSLI
ncbi:hypothetical protein HID58_049155 [Brassica napus]|uniref:Uncharacterized protein n=1 Tax=Brassica napus TaxID=3708 RepID=A0ABQ8B4Y8_BRANA|nr:hypothetical protein HID58_049155 [Brassica napus]